MASVKVLSLAIRTLAKPISAKLKQQAQEHEYFKQICISLAQSMHRNEMRMRTNLLGESKPHIRPLSETKAIATGANFISESFLFFVAVSLIMAETYRGYRKEEKRRDAVQDRLEDLEAGTKQMTEIHETMLSRLSEHQERNDNILKLLEGVVDIGMRGGWMEKVIATDPEIREALEKLQIESKKPAAPSAEVTSTLRRLQEERRLRAEQKEEEKRLQKAAAKPTTPQHNKGSG